MLNYRTDRSCDDLLEHQKWPALVLKRSEPVVNAQEFCKHRRRALVYWRGDFYEWEGTHYRQLSADAVMSEVYSFLDAAKTKIPGEEEGQWVTVPFRPNIATVREVLTALKCLEGRTFVPDGVDAPCWLRGRGNKPSPTNLIALENVVLDLETGEPLPHTADFFTMTALPFAYDEKAKCPRWEEFVGELFSDDAMRREFQKAVGYMLSSDRRMQKVFLVIGPRRSGKGTIMGVMVALLGRGNTVSPDLNELKENFGKEQLINKKAAFFTDERLRGDTSSVVRWLLKLSGDDDVSIPRKNRKNWEGRPAVRLWIATNETPGFDDASGVIASRFIVFRLTQSFFGREDLELSNKLLAELPGILNWAREGLRMLREDGEFRQPKQTKADVEHMRHIASPALAYADERLMLKPDATIDREALYEDYVGWCKKNGHKSQARAKFIRTLMDEYPDLKEGKEGRRGAQVPVLRGVYWRTGSKSNSLRHDTGTEGGGIRRAAGRGTGGSQTTAAPNST